MDAKYQTLTINCPRLIPNEPIYESISSQSDNQSVFIQFQMIGGLIMSFAVSTDKSAYYMIVMIRSLQLISHTPLFNIKFQGNFIEQVNIINPVV